MEPLDDEPPQNEPQNLKLNIKTENISGKATDISPSENASNLMVDSDEDDYSNENEDENFEAWRATERRLSSTNDAEAYDFEDDLGIAMENKNTQRKTDTDIRIFITYLRSINEFRAPELIQSFHLDRYLSAFFSVVKKHDGNEYEPASLRGMLCSVERYLKLKNYPQSVTRDSAFTSTRNALKYKQQKLRELGKGTKKQPEPFGRLSLDKVNHLFSAHEMGPYTPMSVINTLCFLFIVHFRLRKAIDHKNLLWGDIKLQTDENGKKCLIYEPVDVQSSIAHSKYDHYGNRLCIWEQPEVSERDPITIYKLYAEKRPQNMMYENSPFYLGITCMQPSPLQSWYRTCAMGVNKLSDLVRMIRDITGLPRATGNLPTEIIVSGNYGTTLPSKPEKNLSTTLVPDTKHSKMFAITSMSTGGPHSHGDSNDGNVFEETLDDGSETTEENSQDGRSQTEDEISTETAQENESFTLLTAKSTVQKIMQSLEKNERETFRRWMTTFISEDSEDTSIGPKVQPKSSLSMPSITLNIKISPEAFSGGSPVSIVADVKPPTQNETNSVSVQKRKIDVIDKENSVKRPREQCSASPVNLSSNNIRNQTITSDNTSIATCARLMSKHQGNTAVVHPRSDKINQKDLPLTPDAQCNEIAVNNTPQAKRNSAEGLGYIVPISFPYIAPSCFTQDNRMLFSGNVMPHLAHSGVNTPFSILQSNFRSSALKSNNQEINRFG